MNFERFEDEIFHDTQLQSELYYSLLNGEQELHSELANALDETDNEKFIDHPFVFCPDYQKDSNALLNFDFKNKEQLSHSYLEKQEYEKYVLLHTPFHQIYAFYNVADKLKDEVYWSLLRHIWLECEIMFMYPDLWIELLSADRPNRHLFVSKNKRIQRTTGSNMKFRFIDAQQMVLENPQAFKAPSKEELDNIKVGHCVKVCINDMERIWVQVTAIRKEKITGTLNNLPIFINANYGDVVSFEKKHIYQIDILKGN